MSEFVSCIQSHMCTVMLCRVLEYASCRESQMCTVMLCRVSAVAAVRHCTKARVMSEYAGGEYVHMQVDM